MAGGVLHDTTQNPPAADTSQPVMKPSYTLSLPPPPSASSRSSIRVSAGKSSQISESLQENPRPHGVEKMETKEKLYRVHVGPKKNYRAIYNIQDEVLLVLVVKVGDRKEVYRHMK